MKKDNVQIIFLEIEVLFSKNEKLSIIGKKASNCLHELDITANPKPEHNTLVVRQTAPLTTCHERLGHVATKTVQIMASRNVVYGLYSGDTSITTDAMVACIEKGIEDIT
jgi:hypothetical protein